jgi:hypothetical protein
MSAAGHDTLLGYRSTYRGPLSTVGDPTADATGAADRASDATDD